MSQLYDNGVIRVKVPKGWNAFGTTDSEGKETLKKIFVYKNAQNPMDIFSKAGITICYFSPKDYYLSPKGFYDNVEELSPISLGEYLWEGYTCTSLGYPYTMLEGKNQKGLFQVMMLMENNGERLSLEDEDVVEILASIECCQ